jgi:hypothetical protein
MRRHRKADGSRRKPLDLWLPPEGAGEPFVCLASTFTCDPSFFETECLGRFLRMDTHPQEGEDVGYTVEREEKLASTRVSVLVDRRHAQAFKTLRWDLLPVFVPNALQHAKLSILCWVDYVRVIIGSGNLTAQDYLGNLEVFGTLEASRSDGGAISEILASIEFLEQMVGFALGDDMRQGPRRRVRDTLELLRSHIRPWPRQVRRGLKMIPIFGGTGGAILDDLRDIWPSSEPPRAAHILSPFFDREDQDGSTISALIDLLDREGDRSINLYVPTEEMADGTVRLFAPRSVADAANEVCETRIFRVLPVQDGETKPLHARILILENDEWELWSIGSSNFTRAGLGLAGAGANLEANLAYIAPKGEAEYIPLPESVWPDIDEEALDIDQNAFVWQPLFENEGEGRSVIGLLPAFREALYDAARKRLVLWLDTGLPKTWHIKLDESELLNSSTWSGDASGYAIEWGERPIPIALCVEWESRNGVRMANWPVNALDPAQLPPPEPLRNLALEELLEILCSPQPLYRSVVETLEKRAGRSSGETRLDSDLQIKPETLFLRRTKRVALALERLRERMERPLSCIDGLEWRLRGPIGPLALAAALRREARTLGEARFFLAELALTLKRVRADRMASERLSGAINARILSSILEIERIAESVAASLSRGEAAIDLYAQRAFLEAGR